jgi:SpoVK/Ycf46/Vps4 family AAA+-type ATPase
VYDFKGNSKTLLAKAVATESNLHFMAIKGPQLLNKWVGESEKAIRQVFLHARAASPTVLFFDEIDAIAGRRGSDGSSSTSGVNDRMLTQLLIELDGITPRNHIIFIAATNRPDILDPALLRPGRLDRHIYIRMPDKEARLAILSICRDQMASFSSDINLAFLSKATHGYSGAELVSLCQSAAMFAMDDDPVNAQKVILVAKSTSLLSIISLCPPIDSSRAF